MKPVLETHTPSHLGQPPLPRGTFSQACGALIHRNRLAVFDLHDREFALDVAILIDGQRARRTAILRDAFQDIPDGRFYLDAFLKRAKVPLVGAFGTRPEKLIEVATKAYGAVPFDHGDCSVRVKALPLIDVALILWKGDEEFPPEGNVLFDKSISRILSAEDVAWLAGMIVYPLIGMAKP